MDNCLQCPTHWASNTLWDSNMSCSYQLLFQTKCCFLDSIVNAFVSNVCGKQTQVLGIRCCLTDSRKFQHYCRLLHNNVQCLGANFKADRAAWDTPRDSCFWEWWQKGSPRGQCEHRFQPSKARGLWPVAQVRSLRQQEVQESEKQNSLYEVVLWVEQNSAVWKDCAVEENLATQQKIGGW